MSRALQIYYSGFDAVFLKLPDDVRRRIEAAIDDMGLRLGAYPHYRMTGSSHYRLRVGDYRIIYTFDAARNEIHLLAVGHRRDIYRQ
ncbi:MAG: type II toxin-antitoxin system RelE family toxin [Verrucomicrobiota bacterium]